MNKPSRKYWQERFLQLDEALLKKGEAYTIDLDIEYRKAIRDTEKEVELWLRRLAENNEISLHEAKKLLKTKELEEFKWTVQEYIKRGKENAIDQRWMKQLENASARVHISRYEAIMLQMRQRVEELAIGQKDGITDLSKDILKEGYYHTIYEAQTGVGFGLPFAQLNDRVIDMVVSKPWTMDGKNFSDRIWANKQQLIAELHTTLTQSLIRGDAPDKAIAHISKKFDTSRKQAGRLIMTESAYFAAEGQKRAYQELDIEQYEIVATLDVHTSEICQSLDGKVLPMSEYRPGETSPPFHPWCRTVTVPYFEDNYTERFARGADGKIDYVDGDMKYEDWFRSLSKDKQDRMRFDRKKAKNYIQDKAQYEKYKTVLGKEMPLSVKLL